MAIVSIGIYFNNIGYFQKFWRVENLNICRYRCRILSVCSNSRNIEVNIFFKTFTSVSNS